MAFTTYSGNTYQQDIIPGHHIREWRQGIHMEHGRWRQSWLESLTSLAMSTSLINLYLSLPLILWLLVQRPALVSNVLWTQIFRFRVYDTTDREQGNMYIFAILIVQAEHQSPLCRFDHRQRHQIVHRFFPQLVCRSDDERRRAILVLDLLQFRQSPLRRSIEGQIGELRRVAVSTTPRFQAAGETSKRRTLKSCSMFSKLSSSGGFPATRAALKSTHSRLP